MDYTIDLCSVSDISVENVTFSSVFSVSNLKTVEFTLSFNENVHYPGIKYRKIPHSH